MLPNAAATNPIIENTIQKKCITNTQDFLILLELRSKQYDAKASARIQEPYYSI